MMRRLFLMVASGALMTALAVTTAFAQPQEGATLSFEVVTEGEVPQNTTFFGLYGSPNSEFSSVQLADPDGDGTYTGAASSALSGTDIIATGEYVVRIDQGEGTQETVYGTFPGEPSTIIYGPETITLSEDTTISTSVDFGSELDEEQPQCFLPEGCSIAGDGSDEKIVGGTGPDYIVGGGGGDALHGLGGGDWLDGGAGDDLVRGNEGDDLVDGGSGNDLVRGNDGNDYVSGFTGNDILEAGGGSDFIYAADGEFDEVSGGPGYDVCVVDEDDDVRGCEEIYTQ